MCKNSRKEYLLSIKKRYISSSKLEKKNILDEFCSSCGYNRKYSIRILNGKDKKKVLKKLGRRKKYNGEEFKEFLIKTWKASNLPCGKRLKPIIKIWLPKYIDSGENLSTETIRILNEVSAATIDRIFKPIRLIMQKRS